MRGNEKSGLQEKAIGGGLKPINITSEWTKAKQTKGTVVEKWEYMVNGVKYMVDGKHIVLCPTEKERRIASVLSESYGKTVELVPRIMYPQGIQTPDYLIDGERFDLKCFQSSGPNVFYNLIAKKKKQSPNFIFEVTDCLLSIEEMEKQVEGLYRSKHTLFVEKIVLIKNGKIFRVYER